jgi:hypothetical protein
MQAESPEREGLQKRTRGGAPCRLERPQRIPGPSAAIHPEAGLRVPPETCALRCTAAYKRTGRSLGTHSTLRLQLRDNKLLGASLYKESYTAKKTEKQTEFHI